MARITKADLEARISELEQQLEEQNNIITELKEENEEQYNKITELINSKSEEFRKYNERMAKKEEQLEEVTTEKNFYYASLENAKAKIEEQDNIIAKLNNSNVVELKQEKEQQDKKITELEEGLSKYKKLGRKGFNDDSTINLMYSLYLEGKGFAYVSKELFKKGIKSKSNGFISKSTISCILKKAENIEKYLNEEQFKKFTELLESNKRNVKKKAQT